MFDGLRTAIITPLVDHWLTTSRTSWRTLPVPSGPPVAQADGPDPDRVLLVGSGISVGYGMASHDAALPGQLARRVSQLTHRGVQVNVVAGDHLGVDAAIDSLPLTRLRELDLVIATPGCLERLLLIPTAEWSRRIELILDHFADHAPASLRVLFVAVPEISLVVRMPRLLGWLADTGARRLNRVLKASCDARSFADFVPFRPSETAGRAGTGRTYEYWARLLAPSVAGALDKHQRGSAVTLTAA